MARFHGNLRKMKVELANPVAYQLVVGEQMIPLNPYLNKFLSLKFTGAIHCIQCGRKISKSFQQGYCYPCLQRLNECGNCVIFPERCQVEEGTCPQGDWAHRQCYGKQIIYLANASGLKVGITRAEHVPTRWIDQGAIQAIAIFQAVNRYRSGIFEVALKQFVSDRTNWRAMLKNEVSFLDMLAERDRLLKVANTVIQPLIKQSPEKSLVLIDDAHVVEIEYPVLSYPEKIKSLSFDKCAAIEGTLQGIKGQYLILDSGVLNVRKFGGYEVIFHVP